MANIQAIGSTIRSTAIRAGYALKDNAGPILTGASIIGGTAAVGLGIYAAIKKLPAIHEEFNDTVDEIQRNITDPYIEAQTVLDEIGEEEIARLFDKSLDNEPNIEVKREYITKRKIVCEDGQQLEAAYLTKARLKRVGRIIVVFLPTAVCLGGSIVCQITGLKISTKKIVSLGAAVTALTAELASTRKELRSVIGDEAMSNLDRSEVQEVVATTTVMNEDGTTETTETLADVKRRLYCRQYDSHLVSGSDLASCLKMGAAQLLNYETLCNRKLNNPQIGRVYYGDVLRALDFESDACGQNCGWLLRSDDDTEFEGHVDFGCWIVDPETGHKSLNPNAVDEHGLILLNFNVEGEISNLKSFRG